MKRVTRRGSRVLYRPDLLADADRLLGALEATLARSAADASSSPEQRLTLNKPRHHARPQQSQGARKL